MNLKGYIQLVDYVLESYMGNINNALELILRLVVRQFVPQLVEGNLAGLVHAVAAVPRRAVGRTLGPRASFYYVEECLSRLPCSRRLDELLPFFYDSVLGWNLYGDYESKSVIDS